MLKTSQQAQKTVVLLDTHAILHRAYHALPDFASPTGEPTGALYGLSAFLLKLIGELKPDYILAAYDLPEPTYRHVAYDGYKATRQKTDDALVRQIERSRDVLQAFSIPIYQAPGFEADDILGTCADLLTKQNGVDVIIASGDMDTLQLVSGTRVRVYTLKKGIQETVVYDEDGVRERFGFGPELLPDYKGLRGDPSDNIPGIRGIGEKTGQELIKKFGSIEAMYETLKKDRDAFKKEGFTERITGIIEAGEEEALFSKILATIRRDAPIECVLSKKTWKETFTTDPARDLFVTLGFRSLVQRLETKQNGMNTKTDDSTEQSQIEPDEHALREISIALWLMRSDITNPTLEDIYTHTQTRDFKKARGLVMNELTTSGLLPVFETIEKPIIPILDHMNTRGILLNTELLKTLSHDYHKRLAGLQKEIWKKSGSEFNINSPKQLADVLYNTLGLAGKKKTATGQRSTKESELLKLKDTHPIVTLILAYRELQKLLSTYIDTFPKLLGRDGRLHATFLQAGTATGRMASQNPNLQNIPIRTELGRAIRNVFVVPQGMKLVAFDYSQIELRIAAILSGDEKLSQAFKNGEDIHRSVASHMFNVPVEAVTPDMRRTAKVINFGILYGMGVNALAQTAEISRTEATKYLTEYEGEFVGLMKYMEDMKQNARSKGFTETLFGRRRHFPNMSGMLPHLRAEAERQAINAPIQGTNADVVKIAMKRIDEYLQAKKLSDKVFLLLQIHDELVYEMDESVVATVAPQLKHIMESIMSPEQTHGVPIVVDVSVGNNWGMMTRLETL